MGVGGGHLTFSETAGWKTLKTASWKHLSCNAAHSWRDLEAAQFTLSPVSPPGNVSHLQVCVLRVTPQLTAFISQCTVEMLCTCFCQPAGRTQTSWLSKNEKKEEKKRRKKKGQDRYPSMLQKMDFKVINLSLKSSKTFSDLSSLRVK